MPECWQNRLFRHTGERNIEKKDVQEALERYSVEEALRTSVGHLVDRRASVQENTEHIESTQCRCHAGSSGPKMCDVYFDPGRVLLDASGAVGQRCPEVRMTPLRFVKLAMEKPELCSGKWTAERRAQRILPETVGVQTKMEEPECRKEKEEDRSGQEAAETVKETARREAAADADRSGCSPAAGAAEVSTAETLDGTEKTAAGNCGQQERAGEKKPAETECIHQWPGGWVCGRDPGEKDLITAGSNMAAVALDMGNWDLYYRVAWWSMEGWSMIQSAYVKMNRPVVRWILLPPLEETP